VVLNEKLLFSLHFLTNEEKLWMIELTQQRCYEEQKSSKIDKADFDVLPRKSIAHKIKLWEGKQALETESVKFNDESSIHNSSSGAIVDNSTCMDEEKSKLSYIEEVNSSDVERLAENIDLIGAIRKNKYELKANGEKNSSSRNNNLEIAKDSMLFDFSRKELVKKSDLKADDKTCDTNDNNELKELTCDSCEDLNDSHNSDTFSSSSEDDEFVTTKRKSLGRFLPRKLAESLENILDI